VIARLGCAGFVLFVLAACSVGTPIPEDRFYDINPEISTASMEPVLKGGLSIAHVNADPLRNGRAILYRDERRPLELSRYHYEFWADQPSRMIQQALLGALRQSGVADRVESEGRHPHFRYELAVKVRHFESLLDSGRTNADVELEVGLHTVSDGNPVWIKVYRQRIMSSKGDMHALADAMQQALGKIFEQLIRDLKVAATDKN